MTTANTSPKVQVPPELLAEAGVWIARLHGPNRTADMDNGFRQWLATSPLHARAFELATEVWDDSQNLLRVLPWESARSRGQGFRVAMALAAAAIVAVVGTFLYLHQAGVSTQVGEQRLLTLEDGTRVFLNTDTRVLVRYNERERRVELANGEALFDVAKRGNWPFIVSAGGRQIRALGTSFVVRRDEAQRRVSVTLVEGKVSVESVGDVREPEHADNASAIDSEIVDAGDNVSTTRQPIVLAAGERLTFADDRPPALDRPTLEAVIAWRRGQVVLDDTPLADAVAEMNRYSVTKLVIARPEAGDLLVNGLFQAGDSESFATAVAQTYGLEVVEEGTRIVLAGVPQ